MNSQGPLPLPDIEWRDGHLRAVDVDDIYFSSADGLAETRHVFLDGTNLPDAWTGKKHFIIGELGFGTGLNFLAAWDLWCKSKPSGSHLHFISVEGAPLDIAQLARAHETFPELAELSARLRECCPPRARGHHAFRLADDVSLHLLFGEALEMLHGLDAMVDAWFLDGFAPAKNPAMWSSDVMAEIARCSNEEARLATFTAAGEVRRALEHVGFEVKKVPGFGRKRHMLKAQYKGTRTIDKMPWFAKPKPLEGRRVAIIGAGIAGASVAASLTHAGCTPVLFDAGKAPGAGGSGAPAALVMPRLSAEADAPARFFANALRHAVDTYRQANALSSGGALRLAPRPDQLFRLEKMPETGLLPPERIEFLSPAQASARAGTTVLTPALYFADAGVLDARAYLHKTLRDMNVQFDCPIASITRTQNEWHLIGKGGEPVHTADIVIIAAGMASCALFPHAHLPLEARHGQITKIKGTGSHLPIAFGGYVAPTPDGTWVGATHTTGLPTDMPQIDPQADEANLVNLAAVLPDLDTDTRVVNNWAGTRATTSDFLPIAGPLCDAENYLQDFAPYAKGMRYGLPNPSYKPGLFVIAGLGSRGFVTAPLLGELITAQILGTPLPVEREVSHILHPARFLLRQLRYGTSSADQQPA